MTIKALVWDMEGVLMLTDENDISLTIAKVLNAPYEKVREIYFSDTNDKVDLGVITMDQFNEYVLDTLQISRDKKHLLEEVFYERAYIDEDLLKQIMEMGREYKVGLLSNYSNDLRPRIEKEWAIDSVFDEIIISCEVGMIKPDPAIFSLMLDRLGVKADESVIRPPQSDALDVQKMPGSDVVRGDVFSARATAEGE